MTTAAEAIEARPTLEQLIEAYGEARHKHGHHTYAEPTASARSAILDRMAELERANAWQPIESCPMDKQVLLAGAKRLAMTVGMHHSRDGWVSDSTSEWMSMYPPTHWRPLPSAPDAKEQA